MWRQRRAWKMVELLFVAAGDGCGEVVEAATGGWVDESAR